MFLGLVFWTCFSSLTGSLNDIKKEMELEDITCDIKYRSAGLSLELWHWKPFYGLHRPCTPCMFWIHCCRVPFHSYPPYIFSLMMMIVDASMVMRRRRTLLRFLVLKGMNKERKERSLS